VQHRRFENPLDPLHAAEARSPCRVHHSERLGQSAARPSGQSMPDRPVRHCADARRRRGPQSRFPIEASGRDCPIARARKPSAHRVWANRAKSARKPPLPFTLEVNIPRR
jgi:hypothetical protein